MEITHHEWAFYSSFEKLMKGREEGSSEQEDGGWLERSSEEARAEERTEA